MENLPESRPQSGLNDTDIVFEEPVEAGITRFIAIYQCTGAARVEPVRSARLEDPDVVRQFGRALFAHAGGVVKVTARLHQAHLIDMNFIQYASDFHRDPARYAPHNLYTSTDELWKSAPGKLGAPPRAVHLRPDASRRAARARRRGCTCRSATTRTCTGAGTRSTPCGSGTTAASRTP